MTDGFDVDPEAVRDMGLGLRDSLEPLLRAAGQVPEAEAGLMTLVIERAIASILEGIRGYSSSVADMGDDMVRSALHYHWADQEAQESFAQLLAPGTTDREAHRLFADPPGSVWSQVEDEQLSDLRDLFFPTGPTAPSTSDGAHGSGLEGLLLGPLEGDGSAPRPGDDDDAP